MNQGYSFAVYQHSSLLVLFWSSPPWLMPKELYLISPASQLAAALRFPWKLNLKCHLFLTRLKKTDTDRRKRAITCVWLNFNSYDKKKIINCYCFSNISCKSRQAGIMSHEGVLLSDGCMCCKPHPEAGWGGKVRLEKAQDVWVSFERKLWIVTSEYILLSVPIILTGSCPSYLNTIIMHTMPVYKTFSIRIMAL